MKFTYSIPTKILFGPGSFNDLATTPLPGKKAFVVKMCIRDRYAALKAGGHQILATSCTPESKPLGAYDFTKPTACLLYTSRCV